MITIEIKCEFMDVNTIHLMRSGGYVEVQVHTIGLQPEKIATGVVVSYRDEPEPVIYGKSHESKRK
jgi:hypothetical protein